MRQAEAVLVRTLALAAALLPGAARSAARQADAGDAFAAGGFIEVASERGVGYVGEAVRVRLRFGFEEAFLAERMIQPFRRALDVPAQIEAPWLAEPDGLPGLVDGVRVLPETPVSDGASVALNDRVATASRGGELVRDGLRYRVFELERAFVLDAPGELALAAPVLRFAYATSFADDLVAGRRPTDRRDATIRGRALALPIRALPDGAPDGFAGAVGRYTAVASATPLDVDAGASVQLVLELRRAEGTAGDLFGFGAPELGQRAEFAGFHVRGHVERRPGDARVIVYDLAPRDARVTAIPALAVPFFDPERAAWDAARTAAIPLRVRGAAADPRGDQESDGVLVLPVIVLLLSIGAGAVLVCALALRRARSPSAR